MKSLPISTAVLIVLLSYFAFTGVAGGGTSTHPSMDGGGLEPNAIAPVHYVPNEILVKFRRTIAGAIEAQLDLSVPASQLTMSPQLDAMNAAYHVTEIKPVIKDFRARHQRIRSLCRKDRNLLSARDKRIVRRLSRAPRDAKAPDLGRIYKIQVELEPGQSLEQLVRAYNDDPDVEYAELNYIVSTFKTPNDPRYSVPGMWALDKIDAPEAWDVNTGSSDIVVAVIDTGVDYTHRDMVGNMWINQAESGGTPGVDDDENGYVDDIYGYDFENQDSDPMDDNGHGTHCAGTIAGVGNNGLDVAGICWNARIMAIKFLGADGGTVSDAATSFYYAVENGADVTSNSWGSSSISQTEREAIEYAYSQGVITVAAAGNDNSSVPMYPAAHENVTAVAATDSGDAKASFSNYGDLVDIAAPGVDILSLRAAGTSMGSPYDAYTTTAEGTSMACPHIAGACALLLCRYPTLTCDEVYDILVKTADPIAPGICLSNGRVNLFAMLVAKSRGKITLDRDYYSCSAVMSISLADADLEGTGTQQVSLTTSGGDYEAVLLTETVPTLGVFSGTISIAPGDANMFDGTIQVAHHQTIAAIYYDDDDGTGNPAVVTDTAIIDCEPPVIFNVHTETASIAARIMFETDEPTTGRVRCAPTCGGPYTVVGDDLSLAMAHTIVLTGLSSETTYYFVVDANDVVGQQTTDDNYGVCYSFVTGTARVLRVPSEFSTIQAAIDEALWYGDTVLVTDRIYQGDGNRDIDFRGKAITLSSENGPENCIIDCQGTEPNPHRALHFYNAEAEASILDGFTIINGYAPGYEGGGGIKCSGSDPTITNCIISGNWGFRGGGMRNDNSSPALINCTFTGNSSDSDGGGMYNRDNSSPTLTNCTFTGNSSTNWSGGGMYNRESSSPTLTDCTFSNNTADSVSGGRGGAMRNEYQCHPTLTNCTFSGNSAGDWGGGMCNYPDCNPTLVDCTFSANVSTANSGGGMCNSQNSRPTLTKCTFAGNSCGSSGGGMCNFERSNPTLSICTFTGNSCGSRGGGMNNEHGSSPTLTNCRFTENTALGSDGGGMCNAENSNPKLTNCVFVGNSSADWSGGGMRTTNSHANLTNCTFMSNSANNEGGGIDIHEGSAALNNCIFWGNSDSGGTAESAQIHLYTSELAINYSCVQSWSGSLGGTGNIGVNPLFVSGDYHLQADSPCINAGDPGYATDANDVDIDGDRRVIWGRVDIGADEYNPAARFPDIDFDGIVNFYDFAILAYYWMDNVCSAPNWCQGSDLNNSGSADLDDLEILCEYWLEPPL